MPKMKIAKTFLTDQVYRVKGKYRDLSPSEVTAIYSIAVSVEDYYDSHGIVKSLAKRGFVKIGRGKSDLLTVKITRKGYRAFMRSYLVANAHRHGGQDHYETP